MNQNNQKNQSDLNNQSNQKTAAASKAQALQKITFLPRHGHYRYLRVYQVTEVIYDITYYFTHRYLR